MLRLISAAATIALVSGAGHMQNENPEILAVRDDLVINLPPGKTVAFERDGYQSMDLEAN